MSKKPKKKSIVTKELSIEQKEKNLKQEIIIELIAATLFLFYTLGSYACYSAYHPRLSFAERLSGTIAEVMANPLYMFPINYSMGLTAGVILIADVFIFLDYTYRRMRIHNNTNTLHGRTQWADVADIVARYAVWGGQGRYRDYKNQFKNVPLSKNIYISLDQKVHYHNLNTLVLGTAGTGKSRYVLKPNLLQMNSSYVVTDPKGAIASEVGECLRRNGYKVSVFDISQMKNCDTYNPLAYCDTEADVKRIVEAFIANTDKSGGKSNGNKDPFWDDAMNSFLCCVISLLTLTPKGEDKPYAQMPQIMGEKIYFPCFANVIELTRQANKPWSPDCGIPLLQGVRLGDGKNNTANKSTISAIFENIRAYEAEKQDVPASQIDKPYTLRKWESFCTAPEKTSTTILTTTLVRLDPFDIEEVRDLTSTDTLDLHHFGDEKCVLFIIIPTNDRTYNFLAAFLYTQIFDQLYRRCEVGYQGSSNLFLPNGDLVKHFYKEEVITGADKEFLEAVKNTQMKEVLVSDAVVKGIGKNSGEIKDAYYDIETTDGTWIGRRPTRKLAEQMVKELKSATLKKCNDDGFNPMACHMRFLMDEFPNIGEVPNFKEKQATMRQYEISVMVICQTITQLKGMYPDDFEVIDGNCAELIFLGGDENSNNEYLEKKMGETTQKGFDDSIDSKRISASYKTEGGKLMRQEDFGRIDFSKCIIFIFGEQPIMDDKFDYPSHKNHVFTNDYAVDNNVKAFILDRTVMGAHEGSDITLTHKKPKAIPNVSDFSMEAFRRIMGKFNNEAAINALYSNYMDGL